MRYILLLMLLGSAFILKGQEFEGRIELYGDQYIISDSIVLNEAENSITFQSRLNYNLDGYKNSRIKSIQKRDGDYLVTGLIVGAVASPLMYAFVRGYDKFTFDSFALTNFVGIALGVTLGVITKKYTKIFSDKDTEFSLIEKIEILPNSFEYKISLITFNLNVN